LRAFCRLSPDDLHSCTTKTRAGYDTVTLKWSAPPRADAAAMFVCHSVHRVTIAEGFSRPSTCLTNFILNGRIVTLEKPLRDGTTVKSHMLSSYKDEIFIHSLVQPRTFDEVPGIADGVGGKLTDYRTNVRYFLLLLLSFFYLSILLLF
jgi:hypothetical protein